jgi:HD-GYP domain-containing protein (c-di-GMP phosphodiesterase class II)
MKMLRLQRSSVPLNKPLPFSVYGSDGLLLLAQGQVLTSGEQLERLIERGFWVRADEVGAAAPASPAEQPAGQAESTKSVMSQLRNQLKVVLFDPDSCDNVKSDICSISRTLSKLASQNAASAMFHSLHGPPDKHSMYSVAHAMQCSIAVHLVAERMQYTPQERDSLVSAALTMNIGMTQLQGNLATQGTPPTPEQRALIRNHPQEGVELLQRVGVDDATWLRAVLEHHETPDGKGYPGRLKTAFEPAEVLRQIDVFMAKLKSRATRTAFSPNKAVLDMFAGADASPIVAAIVKEFGLYPPGTFVRLANGEVAIVVAQGQAVNKPVAAAIVADSGNAMPRPVRRDTANPLYSITALIDAQNVLVRVDLDKLYE